MNIWLFTLIVFAGAFLGAFLASCFEFERREEKKDGKERIPGKTED